MLSLKFNLAALWFWEDDFLISNNDCEVSRSWYTVHLHRVMLPPNRIQHRYANIILLVSLLSRIIARCKY